MREILFRGKRVDNGEWVEGYLVKLGRESFSDHERYGICKKAIPIGGSGVCYNIKIDEVIPETVGQYTGLCDKNGNKIFEGDIVKVCGMNIDMVEFSCGCFVLKRQVYGCEFTHQCFYTIEVIGNIHDNPELLEVRK